MVWVSKRSKHVETYDTCDTLLMLLVRVILPAAFDRSSQLTTYGLEPRVVFHIWRPVINENLIKFWFPKAGTKVCRVLTSKPRPLSRTPAWRCEG